MSSEGDTRRGRQENVWFLRAAILIDFPMMLAMMRLTTTIEMCDVWFN
jgi:hypothetical protein